MRYHVEKNSVQETLIIPLYGRALCTRRSPGLFSDPAGRGTAGADRRRPHEAADRADGFSGGIAMAGFFANTRKPEGLGGKLMVAMMNWGHAPVARWGRSFLRLKSGAQLLDLGCGGGANLAALLKLCPDGAVVGLDYSAVSVEKARAVNRRAIAEGRCQVIQGDVRELPLEMAPSTKLPPLRPFTSGPIWRTPSGRCSGCCGPVGAFLSAMSQTEETRNRRSGAASSAA